MMSGCHSCVKADKKGEHVEKAALSHDVADFLVNAPKIFAQAPHFSYRSELSITTKKGDTTEENNEAIEIVGAKPLIHFIKKIDSTHFFEIIAAGDAHYVRNGGKDFQRGSESTPMYRMLIDDGFNLLQVLLTGFALHDRATAEDDGPGKKIYTLKSGPLSTQAPYVQALIAKVPTMQEISHSDASGSFSIDTKTGLPLSGTLSASLEGKDGNALWIKASFDLELSQKGREIALPSINNDELPNYPVDVGRRFNELLDAKASK